MSTAAYSHDNVVRLFPGTSPPGASGALTPNALETLHHIEITRDIGQLRQLSDELRTARRELAAIVCSGHAGMAILAQSPGASADDLLDLVDNLEAGINALIGAITAHQAAT
jgi:hypothetical protein